MDFNKMTLEEAVIAIKEQKQRVDDTAYWHWDKKVELMKKYEKLLESINYLYDNQKYFNDINFINSEIAKI